ncbi:MAG: bifunctional sulfate adenylyltransferase/adenylylsulfate kinase [Acidobacteriota bacterium]|nr:bifunctional sulfate adenylyltransferase/adenylylsulfate kinase [Acidobacteriota bacterium]
MTLIPPYGDKLISLFAEADGSALPSIRLSERSRCDLELLATGAFSPVGRFMGRADYESVLDRMRLTNGFVFPMPITLPIDDDQAIETGSEVALRGPHNEILAVMRIDEVFERRADEALRVCGTSDTRHPMVAEMSSWGRRAISGSMRVIATGASTDFADLRRTPAEVRALLETIGRENVVAFQTRNPMHRAHEELTLRAIEKLDGVLLLHPSVGMTKPGDVDYLTRVRTYKAVRRFYPEDRIVLSLLPLAMRMAGPREALWHAIIRRNYGASHFIVGRDHASPGGGFYGPYDAQELVASFESEIGVRMIPFRELVYLPSEDRYEEASLVPAGVETRSLSGTQVRDDYLSAGRQLPSWFSRPEVAEILAEGHAPSHRRGFCLWFTGLSGAGKSTTAELVANRLAEYGRRVTLLDGDVVRTHLSKGLGFSKEDRDTNILRIGFVASEIVRHDGAVVCAAVSPYRATRDQVRDLVGATQFIEIFVDTPLEVCESRDTKGLYAAARGGAVQNFTGISDPYEAPARPDLVLETVAATPEQNAERVLDLLRERKLLPVQ